MLLIVEHNFKEPEFKKVIILSVLLFSSIFDKPFRMAHVKSSDLCSLEQVFLSPCSPLHLNTSSS